MEDTVIINDTLSAVCSAPIYVGMGCKKTWIDVTYSVASIVIAIANAFLVYYIFDSNKKKDTEDKDKDRKLGLLKTLVLDYNMPKFYDYFYNLEDVAKELKEDGISNEIKQNINENISDIASNFRKDFIDMFLAIDSNLYDRIQEKTDELTDSLTVAIFDEGVKLSFQPKYDELISGKIKEYRTEIIKILFSYTG